MNDYYLILSSILVYVNYRKKTCILLPLIVSFEFVVGLWLTSQLLYYDAYKFSNLPSILVVRMLITSITAYMIMRYRCNGWATVCGLLYALVFMYQSATFVSLSIDLSRSGFFIENYTLTMRFLSLLVMVSLVLNTFGGGIKNSLGSRLYFIMRRSNSANSFSSRVRARIVRICAKKIQ